MGNLKRGIAGVRLSQHALNRIGPVISAAGFLFVGITLAKRWPEASPLIRNLDILSLGAAAAFAVGGMTVVAHVWHRALRACGVKLKRGTSVAIYFRGEIAKYVPGALWPVVGRAELVKATGASAGAAYSSIVIGLGGWYGAASLIAVLTSVSGTGLWIRTAAWTVVAVALPILLYPRLWHWMADRSRTLFRGSFVVPSRSSVILIILESLVAWSLLGTSTWMVIQAMDPAASFWKALGATALSWLIGFLAVPVPGGLGVREAVFIAAMIGPPVAVAAAAAIVARLVFIATDAGCALVATSAARRRAGQAAAGISDRAFR